MMNSIYVQYFWNNTLGYYWFITFLISGSLVLTTLGSRTMIKRGKTIIITCRSNKDNTFKQESQKHKIFLLYLHTVCMEYMLKMYTGKLHSMTYFKYKYIRPPFLYQCVTSNCTGQVVLHRHSLVWLLNNFRSVWSTGKGKVVQKNLLKVRVVSIKR